MTFRSGEYPGCRQ